MKNLKVIFLGFIGAAIFQLVNNVLQISLFSSVQAKTEDVISATSFNLVDKKGNLRAQFSFSKEGPPGLWLMDERGIARVALGLYSDGTGHIGLQDKNGQMIQLFRSFGGQESPLAIYKKNGMDMMIMGLNPTDQTPFLMRYEKDRKRTLEFGKYDGP